MSNEAITWAFNQDLPMTEKFVLVALADYANENHACFPAYKKTAKRIGASPDTVKRATKRLKDGGFIDVVPGTRSNGSTTSNTYVLKVGVQIAPLPQDATGAGYVSAGEAGGTGALSINPQLNPHSSTPKRTAVPARADTERLCTRLADRIESNGVKRPVISQRWHDEARKLMDIDGYTEGQIAAVIDWCQGDDFWKSNILSMTKLRQKFDQLKLKSDAARPKTPAHNPWSKEAHVY